MYVCRSLSNANLVYVWVKICAIAVRINADWLMIFDSFLVIWKLSDFNVLAELEMEKLKLYISADLINVQHCAFWNIRVHKWKFISSTMAEQVMAMKFKVPFDSVALKPEET